VLDWYSLCAYFEKHIVAQQLGSLDEPFEFVIYERQFRIQAMIGYIVSDTDGEFPIRFMINIGNDLNHHPIYIGIDTIVPIIHVREYISSLRQFLDNFMLPYR
jgi:hypothetical protein